MIKDNLPGLTQPATADQSRATARPKETACPSALPLAFRNFPLTGIDPNKGNDSPGASSPEDIEQCAPLNEKFRPKVPRHEGDELAPGLERPTKRIRSRLPGLAACCRLTQPATAGIVPGKRQDRRKRPVLARYRLHSGIFR